MSALSNKPTFSVTEWTNELGWRKIRLFVILPFDPFCSIGSGQALRRLVMGAPL
jgi:hypothetical protein